jgi:hypothetical protein
MKIVTLSWSFMTGTVVFPVLKAGRIVSATAYEKGEGQWGGRFPVAYAVVTDDCVVETVRRSRVDEASAPTPNRVWQSPSKTGRPGTLCPKPVMFRWADKAERVAREWAARRAS